MWKESYQWKAIGILTNAFVHIKSTSNTAMKPNLMFMEDKQWHMRMQREFVYVNLDWLQCASSETTHRAVLQ